MSYQVLALKYRPQTFDTVVGQSHVTATLSNAIESDRVAHAILFTGPRGTGKTTIARILAKAMNCSRGPSATPCNTCKTCLQIIDGHCADVFEIDGASNNSVDQIRDLRENVTYMPSSAAYKIYIIDEVHMLSTAAFNALLKTLEEPPEHVMFIFATTEVHKIPATILSRCQRHDLGRIQLPSISAHLKKLAETEGFTLDQESYDLLAQEADGSIRDSLSLLDRILSAAPQKTITHEAVLNTLGVLDRQILYDLARGVFAQDGARLIDIVEQVSDSGQDLKTFYTDIIQLFRNLAVIRLCKQNHSALNIPEPDIKKLMELAKPAAPGFLNNILQVLLKEESLIRYASHTRTALEYVLLRLLDINPGAQLDEMILKIDRLADRIRSTARLPEESMVSPETGSPVPASERGQPDSTSYRSPDGFQPNSAAQNPGPVPASQPSVPGEKPSRDWTGFLSHINKTAPFLAALLTNADVSQNNPDKILVELDNCSSFDKKRIDDKLPELNSICRDFLGKDIDINIRSQANRIKKKDLNEIKARQAAFGHPLVVEAQKIFDGRIIN